MDCNQNEQVSCGWSEERVEVEKERGWNCESAGT